MRSTSRYSVLAFLLSQSRLGLCWQDLRTPFSFFSLHDQPWISSAKRAFESKKLPEAEGRRFLVEKTEEKPENILIKYPPADLRNIKEENPIELPFLSNKVNIEDSVEGKIISTPVTTDKVSPSSERRDI